MQNLKAEVGYLRISGPDLEKFLQGQLTCDMKTLTEAPVLAAHCSPQGRIISLFWIYRYENAVLLQMPYDLIETALENLNKYRIFFKATIDSVEAPSLLPAALILTRAQKIEQKIPTVYRITSGVFLPHRIGLLDLGGVSLTKGCYTGQEILLRMEHRAEVKHHLYRTLVSQVLQPGDRLMGGSTLVVDSDWVNGRPMALVTMKDEAALRLQKNDLVDLTQENICH